MNLGPAVKVPRPNLWTAMEFLKFHYIKLVHFLNCTATFQMLNSRIWGVATTVNRTGTERLHCCRKTYRQHQFLQGMRWRGEGCAWRVPHYHFS